MKHSWKPGTMIYPLPAVMVSCGSCPEEYNIITVAWVGTICTNPPMCYISVRPERYSYHMIETSGEFVVNLTTEQLVRATDFCVARPRAVHGSGAMFSGVTGETAPFPSVALSYAPRGRGVPPPCGRQGRIPC